MKATWDPGQYAVFAGERDRPFFELVGRVGAEDPRHVTDLGCGTGSQTATLLERWPAAEIEGVDSSPDMIARAKALPRDARLAFHCLDLADWRPAEPVDVIVSNAALHWVPDHVDLLPRLVASLAPGGWLAFQVPGNFEAPSHTLLAELQTSPRWHRQLADVVDSLGSRPAAEYLERLHGVGCTVDAWETTYLHVLQGEDPVLAWTMGTVLRPALSRLADPDRQEFLGEYAAALREAYPARPFGTLFPFRRIFVVARRTP